MVDGMRMMRGPKAQRRSGAFDRSAVSSLRRSALMVAAAFGALTSLAHANPEGAKVVNGQATITSHGNTLVIKNTPGAIINWQSFSIGAGQITDFVQQSVNSAILNRVVGVDPSVILGTLESNGHVFLVNPNGVVFGKGATVDAAGLVVSSLDITDQDFKNGTLRFVGSAAAGDISVAGVLRSSDGDVYLIAPNVTNTGSITATNGAVVLAAGQDVEILGSGLTDIQFNVQNKGNTAINLGQINGDAVGIFAGTLTQAGGVNATTATVTGGKVVLSALGDVSLASGSSTTADNAGGTAGSIAIQSVGGNISMASGANVSASGASGGTITLLASAGNDSVGGHLAATGELTLAGSIDVLGQTVALGSNAAVDASGNTGGGQIVVGGLAKSAALLQSSTTTVDAGAVLSADATGSGDGGHVVVFGGSFMRMDGSISAQGGVAGGNGGLIETSGEVISIGDGAIAASARAAGGKPGTWLLDPGAINITNGGSTYFLGTTSSSIDPATIATVLDNGTSVVVATSNVIGPAGGELDSITVSNIINATAVKAGAQLSLSAGGDIFINAGITGISGGSPLTLNLLSNLEGSGGVIHVAQPIYLPGGTLTASGSSFSNTNTITASTVTVTATAAAGIVNSDIIDASSTTNGGTAGGTVNLSASSGSISTGNIRANSDGGTTGSIIVTGFGVNITGPMGVYDSGASSGGTIQITSTNGITAGSGAVLDAAGGNGGNSGGNGGTVSITNSGVGAINLSGLNIAANGVSGLLTGSGGDGGAGGSASITSASLPLNLTNVSINVNGGAGVSLISGSTGSAGGDAGNITISGGSIAITGGTLVAMGGAGSLGGTGSSIFNAYNGGTGGTGGTISITAVGTLSDSGTIIKTQGGAGGAGGNYVGGSGTVGQTAGYGGTGGYGGSIQLEGHGGITLTGVTYQTIGGVGGAGGQTTGTMPDAAYSLGGNGGPGGDGGSISIQEDASNISIINSTFVMTGGAGGAGLESPQHLGYGGNGGAGGNLSAQYAFNLSALGGITIDSATHITVQGGVGGAGSPGWQTNNVSGYTTQAGNGGDGGDVSGVLINGSGAVSLAGTISILGGAGGAGGNLFGTTTEHGNNIVAGNGGNGGSIGLSSTALSLSAIGGNLTHTGSISIIGGAGGAGGFGADTLTLAGNGGNGGNIGEIDIYSNQSANFAGTLSIIGGAGGGITNTNNGVGVISGSGGSQIQSLYIEGDQALNLGGIINLEVGPSGPITGAGTAGGTGTLQSISLSSEGAITQSAGALVSTSTPLNVNATAGSVSLNSPSNSIGILNASASTGAITVVSMIDMEVQSAFAANSISLVAANGTTGNLTVDNAISTTAGYINLSAGSQVIVGGGLNAPSIYIASGTLTLNGNVTGSNLIDIALSNGAIANNGQTLSAPVYVLNAAAGVGNAATPLTLSPPEGATTEVSGGSTGAGFYVTAAGDIAVNNGLAITAAGGVELLGGGAVYNLGTISGANVNLSGTVFVSNFGVIDTGGTLTMTAPTVVNQGSASAGTINLLATDVNIISGSLVASGDMSISGGALSIGYNGASTNVSAHSISIAVDSLSVSPDISGSGTNSGSGAPLVSISSAGTLTISTTGDATFVAGSEPGSYVSVTSVGDSTYNIGGNLSLTGGTGAHAYVLLDPTAPGTTMTINATNLGLTGGSGDGSYAAIQSVKNVIINATSGSIMLTQGAGSDADAVVVAGTGGSIVANTPSCINCVQTTGPHPIGDGVTEQGFYVATAPAPAPVAAPPAAPQPNQTAIDAFINGIVVLLDMPLSDQSNGGLDSTVLVDGTTDGCL